MPVDSSFDSSLQEPEYTTTHQKPIEGEPVYFEKPKKEHNHDYKLIGFNKPVAQFGGAVMRGYHYKCRCGAYELRGTLPKRKSKVRKK